MAVVAAVEFDEHVATGACSGKAQGAHRGFGARGDEADQVDARKRFLDQVGQFDLGFGRCAETGAFGSLCLRPWEASRLFPGLRLTREFFGAWFVILVANSSTRQRVFALS